MADQLDVLVFGEDSSTKTIQPLPIKFGALQVSVINSGSSGDALSNNLFHYTVGVQPGTLGAGLALQNSLGSGKLIQIVKMYLNCFSVSIGSPPASNVQSQAFYINAYKQTPAGTPASGTYYNVLDNNAVAVPGIDLTIEAAFDNTFPMAQMGTFSFLETSIIPTVDGNYSVSQINNIESDVPVFIPPGQGMWLAAESVEGITWDMLVNAEVYFKLIDV